LCIKSELTFMQLSMKRLKTLCVILLFVFFGSIYQGAVLPFVEGVKYGLTVAKYQIEHQNKTEDFLLMDVVAKDLNYLDESEINLKTGEKVLIRPNSLTVMVKALPDKSSWWITIHILYFVITVVTLIIGVWVPFLVIKIVRSLQNSEVFDRLNLKRINRIGIILLGLGILGTLLQVMNIYNAQTMVNLSHYNFTYSKVIDFNAIIMGIVILIMNEILRLGTVM
jgi:hypothetical protein